MRWKVFGKKSPWGISLNNQMYASLKNLKKFEKFEKIEKFEKVSKQKCQQSDLIHVTKGWKIDHRYKIVLI